MAVLLPDDSERQQYHYCDWRSGGTYGTHSAFYGNALAYRALSYMDLTRLYEYKKTGVASLDGQAESNGIYGLTVVIIDENFDVTLAQNNPRVPFYHMYRFIMTDLNRAEHYLQGYVRSSKIRADLSVVESLKARMWLEIATRFQKYPEDLQTQIAHENDEDLAIYDKLGSHLQHSVMKKPQSMPERLLENILRSQSSNGTV